MKAGSLKSFGYGCSINVFMYCIYEAPFYSTLLHKKQANAIGCCRVLMNNMNTDIEFSLCIQSSDVPLYLYRHVVRYNSAVSQHYKLTVTIMLSLPRKRNTMHDYVYRRPNYKLQLGWVCNKVGRSSSLPTPRGNARVISFG